MARKEAYDEDRMMTAVIKYSEAYEGKIQYADLARYASATIPGLKGIQARHFSRPVKDPDTGEMVPRESRKKVEEINAERELVKDANMDLILMGKIDDFYNLTDIAQRECLQAVKNALSVLIKERAAYEKQSIAYRNENIRLKNEIDAISKEFKDYNRMKKQYEFLVNKYTEDGCRKILEEEGISSKGFNANKHREFLSSSKIDNKEVEDALGLGEGIF